MSSKSSEPSSDLVTSNDNDSTPKPPKELLPCNRADEIAWAFPQEYKGSV